MSLTAFQFRFCPGLFVHHDHLPQPLLGVLASLEAWQEDSRINGYLLSDLGLSCDYQQPTGLAGLGLLGSEELLKALYMLGAMLHGHSIRSTLEPNIQQQLRNVLGEQGVRSCLSQVDIIIGSWPSGWQQSMPKQGVAEQLLHTGLSFWLAASAPLDEAFAKRLRLRLPKFTQTIDYDIALEQRPLAKALCMKVTKLVIPECLHLLN